MAQGRDAQKEAAALRRRLPDDEVPETPRRRRQRYDGDLRTPEVTIRIVRRRVMHGREFASDEDGDGPEASAWDGMVVEPTLRPEMQRINELRMFILGHHLFLEAPLAIERAMGLAVRIVDIPDGLVDDAFFEISLEVEYLSDHHHCRVHGSMVGALMDHDPDIARDRWAAFTPLQEAVEEFCARTIQLASWVRPGAQNERVSALQLAMEDWRYTSGRPWLSVEDNPEVTNLNIAHIHALMVGSDGLVHAVHGDGDGGVGSGSTASTSETGL